MNFVLFLFLSNLFSFGISQNNCIWKNEVSGQLWKLVWEENFNSKSLDSNQWKVASSEEDSQFCDSFLECLSSDNVFLFGGFLFVTSKFYEYENYTSSKITTPKFVKPGRFEVRAKLPNDPTSVTRIQTSIDSSQESFINAIVKFQETYQSFKMQTKLIKNEVFDQPNISEQNEFHIFGFEWTYEKLVFFWDKTFTTEMKFGKDLSKQMLLTKAALQMTIEVSYPTRRMHILNDDFYSLTLNLKSKKLACTALVIDYVKLYANIEKREFEPECNSFDKKDETIVKNIDKTTCKVLPTKTESIFTGTKTLELTEKLIGADQNVTNFKATKSSVLTISPFQGVFAILFIFVFLTLT